MQTTERALVLGANGQDGSFACEHLIRKGISVTGIGKQSTARYPIDSELFTYVQTDLREVDAVRDVLYTSKSNRIYHLAAVHGAAGFEYEPVWQDALDVNVKILHLLLEYARTRQEEVRIFYPSSAKVFGSPLEGVIDINSPKVASCLYSTTKICAANLIDYYRNKHNVFASIGYLFNHDSPRRPDNYFLPRIAKALNYGRQNQDHKESIYTLDFYCDWGSASEFMTFAVDALELAQSSDFILASGNTVFARTFVADLFNSHQLNYKSFVAEAKPNQRAIKYEVDLSATKQLFGCTPQRSAADVCEEIALAC